MAAESFNFLSSTIANIWHAQKEPHSYEWWYFDALSDDSKSAIIVIFLDNFIFSPRYNQAARQKVTENFKRFPAIAFFYYENGRPVYRAINEFSEDRFKAESDKPGCKIDENRFSFECAPYGSGYLVEVNTKTYGNQILKARLEWLSVESDLTTEKRFQFVGNQHNWNLVVARADVTGKIQAFDESGKVLFNRDFRGTGYHDHNADSRWLPETVYQWHWGRAHFNDSTVIFYNYEEFDSPPVTKLIVVKNGQTNVLDAKLQTSDFRMSIFGLIYPRRLTFLSSEKGFKLVVKQKVVDASFFYLRFLSEAEIEYPNGQKHFSTAISEYLFPKRLKKSWFDRLIDMRIGKNGIPASLP
ncbi:MAG: hypothetical protein N2Z23_08285 [Pyrinomonadaceae bacterium]|nr:hypothetical protein [Pyrinomonadaceae bacterium]